MAKGDPRILEKPVRIGTAVPDGVGHPFNRRMR